MNVDMLIYLIGAFGIAAVTTGLFLWATITKQYKEDNHLKNKPLEEDEEC